MNNCSKTGDVFSMRKFIEEISFSRAYGTEDNLRAREIICKEFEKIARIHDTSVIPQIIGETKNIIFGNPQTAQILIGAHYDSAPGVPRADDNGSALAVMLKVASKMFSKNILYVAFNGEECGLIGSKEFANTANLPKLREFHVLEMVGYCSYQENSQQSPFGPLVPEFPTTGNFVGVVTNDKQLSDNIVSYNNQEFPLISMSIDQEEITSNRAQAMGLGHIFRSDHDPLWRKGYKGAMWTDTAEFRNFNYHKKTDTPATLDYEFMYNVSNALCNQIEYFYV
jgi:hypothetical protein